MNQLFSPDNKFMQFMSWVADIMLLNIYFLITSLPIVTIGAAHSALYTVIFRFGTPKEEGITRTYFRAFKDNFKQSTILWLILLLCGGTACFNAYLFYMVPGMIRLLSALFVLLFVLVLLIFSYAFPLISQFENGLMATFRNSLALSIGYLPRSVVMVVLNIFPWVLLALNAYIFLFTSFLWVLFYFSLVAYLNTALLKKTLRPYLDEDADDDAS